MDLASKVRPDREFRAELEKICGPESMEDSGELIMPEDETPLEDTPVRRASRNQPQLAARPARAPSQAPSLARLHQRLITGFEELHGDRFFGDDKSIIAGMGFFEGRPVMVIWPAKRP